MSEIKMNGTCDVCGGHFGQHANMKINGLIMCDNCCYDPGKEIIIKKMARLKKGLVEEVERLRGERDELVKLFDGLERVTDIWLPQNVDQEHIGEAECLHGFRRAYLELLAKIKGEDNE